MRHSVFTGIAILAVCISSEAHTDLFPADLESIHQQILEGYEAVEHLTAGEFEKIDHAELVIFDVRKESEYAVSHISSAIQLDPDISAGEFEATYGGQLEGKTIVFYCSVGHRSSKLASDVEQVVNDSNANASYNLTGGIFNWSNENRQLVSGDQSSATNKVHPYNFYWSRLIEDKETISYKPEFSPEQN